MSKISLKLQAEEVELAAMGKRAQIGAREEANRKKPDTYPPATMQRDANIAAALDAASATLGLFAMVDGTPEMDALRARVREMLKSERRENHVATGNRTA